MIMFNTEAEISFIDQMMGNFELKMGDYLDQRQRSVKFDVKEEEQSALLSDGQNAPFEISSELLPKFHFKLRFCYSRVKF